VYGAERFGLGTIGLGRKTPNNWGMFGGYPTAPLQAMMVVDSDIRDWFRESRCPRDVGDLEKLKGTKFYVPPSSPLKPVKSYDLLLVRKGSGGGFGDPLDRDPQRVVADFHRQAISLETAREVYGVVFDPETLALDEEATRQLRKSVFGWRNRLRRSLGSGVSAWFRQFA
jgi:N-methylhydantoinase B/oxoprolinase/acetone carboxylase alpha subunit